MNIMTKRGSLDNIVTYEHYCDTPADLNNIDPHYITLGSVAIVLHDANNTLGAYIADSNKQWVNVAAVNGGGNSGGGNSGNSGELIESEHGATWVPNNDNNDSDLADIGTADNMILKE